jgi:IS30 family transposase
VGQERLPVRKIREVLRLKAEGFSDRQIAAAIGSARSTVQECVRRARDAGIAWPLAPALDGARIVQKKNYSRHRKINPLGKSAEPLKSITCDRLMRNSS